MFDVLEIAQIFKTEGVTVTEPYRSDCRDAGVTDDEALPLPWSGRQPKEMAYENAVGARVGDEGDLLPGIFNVPNRKFTLDPMDTPVRKEFCSTCMYSRNKLTNRFTAVEAVPSIR